MKKTIKILLPLFIIILTALLVTTILSNPPQTKQRDKKPNAGIPVQTVTLKKEDYQLFIDSYGVIQPLRKSSLSAQVSGKITYVSPNFKTGAFIQKGETLLKIEQEDYLIELKAAKAKLTLVKQALIEEQAKAQQAKEDWKRFNATQPANDLVLRKPQLESAKANVQIAQAELDQAKLNLERTVIKAPYHARIDEKMVFLDELISNATKVASISTSETLELRLPINNEYLKYINLQAKPIVRFFSSITNENYEGTIVRSESAIDTNTKQLYLIAELSNKDQGLNIGEYLQAKIQTTVIKDALIIPNGSIYQGSYVFIEKDGFISRRGIEISWQDENSALIKDGLRAGENLVMTNLGEVNSGTKVKVINQQTSKKRENKQKRQRPMKKMQEDKEK